MKTDTTNSPQGINLKKCECPTDNKHAYLFILWICKSYGLFFSYRFALSKGCLKSIFRKQTTQNAQINAILLNWNSANNILLYKSYLRKFVSFALFACFGDNHISFILFCTISTKECRCCRSRISNAFYG